jgi:hypothetical protein
MVLSTDFLPARQRDGEKGQAEEESSDKLNQWWERLSGSCNLEHRSENHNLLHRLRRANNKRMFDETRVVDGLTNERHLFLSVYFTNLPQIRKFMNSNLRTTKRNEFEWIHTETVFCLL